MRGGGKTGRETGSERERVTRRETGSERERQDREGDRE